MQRTWVSHVCDTYKLSARTATGDTDVCHLYFCEDDDDEYDGEDCDGGDDDNDDDG